MQELRVWKADLTLLKKKKKLVVCILMAFLNIIENLSQKNENQGVKNNGKKRPLLCKFI